MSEPLNLTSSAEEAAQMISAFDPGETFSVTMLASLLTIANNIWTNWFQEQSLALQELISEQGQALQIFIDNLNQQARPLVVGYTLAGATYNPANFSSPTVSVGSAPQFPDTTSSISVPNGYGRAFQLSLAIEIAPWFGFQASPDLVRNAAEARAAASPMPGKRPVPGMSAASEAAPQ